MAAQIELLRSAHWAPFRRAPGLLAHSMWVWLGLVAYLAVVELFITLVGAGLEHDPRSVLFSWPSLAIFGSAGLVGIWFSQRTGFPSAWDAHRGRERLVYPTALGLGFGLLAAVLDQLTHGIPFSSSTRAWRSSTPRSPDRCCSIPAARSWSRSSTACCRSHYYCG